MVLSALIKLKETPMGEERNQYSVFKTIKRVGRSFSTIAVTLAFVAIAGLLTVFGSQTIAERANAVVGVEPAPLISVLTQTLEYEDHYTVSRRFIGQTQALQETSIGFEIGGTIVEIMVDVDDTIAKGEAIAKLDTRLLEAETFRLKASRKAVEAQAELSRRTAERQQELNKQGFASSQAMDQASLTLAELNARLAEIDAALIANSINLEKAVITAPYSGRIAERMVDEGATVGNGQPVVMIQQKGRPEFKVGVDPLLARDLETGHEATVNINGEGVKAKLLSVSTNLDPVTRTRALRFIIQSDNVSVFGQTGTLHLQQQINQRGSWVPISAMQEGKRGLWEIMTVVDEGEPTIKAQAVEIVYANEDRAYVRGTFAEGEKLVSSGPHRVVSGQKVTVIGASE